MKNLLLILGLIISLASQAQLPKGQAYPFDRGYERHGYVQVDSGFMQAQRDTSWRPRYAGATVWFNKAQYIWDGYWRKQTPETITAISNTIDSAKWVTLSKYQKDSVLNARLLSGKSDLPDGLTRIGTVTMTSTTAAMAGFYGNYLSLPFKLPDSTITMSANGLTYDRIDAIYYNPVANVYGKVNGAEIENPVKPIPSIPNGTYLIANVRRNVNGTNVVTYGPRAGFVSFDKVESITALKSFNGGITSDNELLNVNKPINTFWQTGYYVNYANAFTKPSTTIVTDPTLLFGKALKIPIGADAAGHSIYGPYTNMLAAGDWVYEFRLKVSDNTSSTDMIAFDIAIGGGTWTDHIMYIKPTDFPDTTHYKTFRMPFTAEMGVPYEFRIRNVLNANPINIYFDYGIAKQPATVDILNITNKSRGSHPFPSMTSAERLALTVTAANDGDHIYQTDSTKGVYVYKAGIGWVFAY